MDQVGIEKIHMSNLKVDADEIGRCCLNLYEKLPKTGKPIENEWTVLSCILQYDNASDRLEVVSLGTGSKCIGATKMSPSGDILNDSHAEVIARRGFLLYLYENINKTLENKDSIFNKENSRFKLKDSIKFIYYSSQLPCGDASIFPKSEEEHYGDVLQSSKRKAQDDVCETDAKKPASDTHRTSAKCLSQNDQDRKEIGVQHYGDVLQSSKRKAQDDVCETDAKKPVSDIHRTGAKCLPQNDQDRKEVGVQYHLLGQVRTKPGRGDRTLSVSCSDKMAKWIHMGIQGRLLDMLLVESIHIAMFVFGSGVPYSEESLTRALLERVPESSIKTKLLPEFHQTSVVFSHVKSETKSRPAAGSIVWTKANNGLVEVAVQGRKQGSTKEKAKSLCSSLCISKYNLYKKFQTILHKDEELKEIIGDNTVDVPYNKMKAKATRYEENWRTVKSNFFKTWTIKPDIWDFCVNIT